MLNKVKRKHYEDAMKELGANHNVEICNIKWLEDENNEIYVDVKIGKGDLNVIYYAWVDSIDERISFTFTETPVMANFHK